MRRPGGPATRIAGREHMQPSSGEPRRGRDAARTPRADCLVDARASLAQGLSWDARAYRLFWVDSPAGRLFCVSLTSGVVQSWPLPCAVGAIALCGDGRLLVVLLDGIYLFDPGTHDLHFLAGLGAGWAGDGLVSGAVGPDGAFWIGGTGCGADGSLLRVSSDGAVERISAMEALVPSGLGWSANGEAMYGADLAGGWIGRWAFDPASGGLASGARIATRGERLAAPGGGAMDSEGAYWSCDASGGCVSRFAPDGRVLMRVPLPVPAPTACCFGGADMRLLFVASRRAGLGAEQLRRHPVAGGIFVIPVGIAGVPARRFQVDAR
jgi:sugar lactone lactonase YvrE